MRRSFCLRLPLPALSLLAFAALCAGLAWLGGLPAEGSPAGGPLSGPVCRADVQGQRAAALSFETLGSSSDTVKILEILEDYGVKATFFLEGRWVESHPEETRLIAAAGHELGNHTQNHKRGLPSQDPAVMAQELSACSGAIAEACGETPSLFRPPYGLWSAALLQAGREQGMEAVLWDVDSLDWKNLPPAQTEALVVEQTRPGSILRFQNSALNTASALPGVLEGLSACGYTLYTVSELLALGQ